MEPETFDFEELLSAAVTNEVADAAASDDAADPSALFAAVFGDDTASPANDDAPDDEDADAPLEAEAEADADLDDDEEDEESEIERIRRERDELLQARREAEAKAAEAEAKAHWVTERNKIDGKLRQALDWLDGEVQSGRHYDTTAFIQREVETIISGYAADLEAFKDEQIRAVWQIAQQHGTQTYLQALTEKFSLSAADLARVKKYPPDLMEQAARDIVEARGSAVAPVAADLTQTKSKLKQTETALKKQRRSRQVTPTGVGRTSAVTLKDVRSRINPDNASDIAGALFEAIGLHP